MSVCLNSGSPQTAIAQWMVVQAVVFLAQFKSVLQLQVINSQCILKL